MDLCGLTVTENRDVHESRQVLSTTLNRQLNKLYHSFLALGDVEIPALDMLDIPIPLLLLLIFKRRCKNDPETQSYCIYPELRQNDRWYIIF